MHPPEHLPVLVRPVVEALASPDPGWLVDATVGLGGHALALLEASPQARLLGLDVFCEALARARRRLAPFADRIRILRASYTTLADTARAEGVESASGALFDLGVSSLQ